MTDKSPVEQIKELAPQARIEMLEADNKRLRSMILDHINSTGDDPEIMAASRAEWATRAKAAEDKLAKALGFLEFLDENYRHAFGDTARTKIRELYAELRGDSDD
jgi:hypothetical protein